MAQEPAGRAGQKTVFSSMLWWLALMLGLSVSLAVYERLRPSSPEVAALGGGAAGLRGRREDASPELEQALLGAKLALVRSEAAYRAKLEIQEIRSKSEVDLVRAVNRRALATVKADALSAKAENIEMKATYELKNANQIKAVADDMMDQIKTVLKASRAARAKKKF